MLFPIFSHLLSPYLYELSLDNINHAACLVTIGACIGDVSSLIYFLICFDVLPNPLCCASPELGSLKCITVIEFCVYI